MTTLRQEMSRKRMLRSVRAFVLPVTLGLTLGVGGFFLVESAATTPAIESTAPPIERVRAAAPAPADARRAVTSRREPVVHQGAYRNCTEARAAGAAPVYANEPGYGPHLDGDDDGIGCEPYPRY